MKILIRQQPGQAWALVESASYTNEAELQRLLAESPTLISMSEIRPEAGPLVVTVREIGLPGSGATDVVGFSALGDIALVECKLAANAEIKRKVIGQVLEYGAYLWGMTYEELDHRVQVRTGASLADLVRAEAGDSDWDERTFRSGIAKTLAQGTFVLLIAVDEMNPELARTVNFLNNCGNPAFAFAALEMRRFQRGVTEILVPEILGAPPSGPIPPQPPIRRWTEPSFMEALTPLAPEVRAIIRDIYDWSTAEADQVAFGQGKEYGSFTFKLRDQGQVLSVFTIYTNGRLNISFGNLSAHLPLELVQDFDRTIAAIPALQPMAGNIIGWPGLPIEAAFLTQPETLSRFRAAVLELRGKLRQS